MEIEDLENRTEIKMASVRDFNIKTLYDIQEIRRQIGELLAETSCKVNLKTDINGKINMKKEFENAKINQRARMCEHNLKKLARYILYFEI